ncbi:MAG: cell division protein FtsA [Candidatus Paceibacterota bacterium]
MIRSLFKKIDYEIVLIFDIGSGSVEGSIVKLVKNALPEILYSYRADLPFRKTRNAEKLTLLIFQELKSVAAHLSKEGLKHPNFTKLENKKIVKSFLVFSSPWTLNKTKIVTISNKKEFLVDSNLVDKTIENEEKNIFESFPEYESESLQIIEKKAVSILLNGYETTLPYGQKTNEITMTLVFSLITRSLAEKCEEITKKYFPFTPSEILSFSMVSFTTLRDMFPEERNFMLLDIGSEVTEITIVRNNAINEVISFPSGKNLLIRNVISKMKIEHEMALSLLNTWLEKHTDHISSKKVSDIISDTEKEWISSFQKAVLSDENKFSIPQTIFITADSNSGEVFAQFLKNENIAQFNKTQGKFKTWVIDREKLLTKCIWRIPHSSEPFIAIESIFLNKIFNSDKQK